MQVDKSSGFHILKLHGFTSGVTSRIFVGGLLILCGAYLALKLSFGRLVRCCCHCPAGLEGQIEVSLGSGGPMMHMVQSPPMQMIPQQQSSLATVQNVDSYASETGTLDLPKFLTLKITR